MRTPLFSIITPTRNRPEELSRTMELVFAQTFSDFEWIVVDDGSDEGVLTIHRELRDPRFVFITQCNQGVSRARNIGAHRAQGRYLIFLDDDDAAGDSWLQNLANHCRYAPDLVLSNYFFKNKSGKINLKKLKEGDRNFIPGTWLIRRELFLQIGGYDECLRFGENTELMIRVDHMRPTIAYSTESDFTYNYNPVGGGRSHSNRVHFINHLFEKHKDYFKERPYLHFRYMQIKGVCCLRIGRINEGRSALILAYFMRPWRIDTLVRLSISLVPWLRRRIYSHN